MENQPKITQIVTGQTSGIDAISRTPYATHLLYGLGDDGEVYLFLKESGDEKIGWVSILGLIKKEEKKNDELSNKD